MSFHCSSTACDGLGAGFGGSFFAASCANTGSTANPIAKASPATHFSFLIFSFLRYARKPDVLSFRRATPPSVSPRPALTWTAVPGLPRGFILRSKPVPVMQNSQPPHGKLVLCTWGEPSRELGLSAAAHRNWLEHSDAALSFAALLVPRSLARHLALGSATAPSWRQGRLHRSPPPGNRYHVSRLGLRPWRLRPPKLHNDRYHRPLVFQHLVCISSRQNSSRAGTPLALAARCNGEKSCPTAKRRAVPARLG